MRRVSIPYFGYFLFLYLFVGCSLLVLFCFVVVFFAKHISGAGVNELLSLV